MIDNVLLIGCGNMGFAMLKGWLDHGIVTSDRIAVVEPVEPLRARVAALGVATVSDIVNLDDEFWARIILVAVKPQVMQHVLPALERFADRAVFVSIVAGVAIDTFERYLGEATAVIRAMPNMPAVIGKGMIATHRNAHVTDGDARLVDKLLRANGEVAALPTEALIDTVTAVSGSGPAYVFHFIECLAEAAMAEGVESQLAMRLSIQTVYGAAALAVSSAETPDVLREQVASPGGTTAAALDFLMGHDGLKELMIQAVYAAHQRAIELGSGTG